MQYQFLSRTSPLLTEAIIVLILGGAVTALLTHTDIVIHDEYILKIIESCHPQNTEQFCQSIREHHGVPYNAQIELGKKYWDLLLTQAISLGIMMFGFRIAIMKFLLKRRITGFRLFVAVLWGATVFSFFYFGWLDYSYYTMRDMEVPDQLPWLDEAGVFTHTKSISGDPTITDKDDLLISMGIGIGVITFLWIIALKMYYNSGLRSMV